MNSFLQELIAMPHDAIAVFLGDLSRMVLDNDADGIKFSFVLNLWGRLELSPIWGPKMEFTRKVWARAIFD